MEKPVEKTQIQITTAPKVEETEKKLQANKASITSIMLNVKRWHQKITKRMASRQKIKDTVNNLKKRFQVIRKYQNSSVQRQLRKLVKKQTVNFENIDWMGKKKNNIFLNYQKLRNMQDGIPYGPVKIHGCYQRFSVPSPLNS